MKIHSSKGREASGTALVLVLASLTIVVIVSIAFFSSVTTESLSSKAQTDAAASAQLGDSVTKLVMATISEATSGKNGASTVAWASQPGMIRTWDASGNPDRVFRLYSSENMIGTSFSAGADAAALSNWKSNSSSFNALWCDLNSPAVTANATLVYPIVTPPTSLDASNGIVKDDPATSAQEGVQGFDITSQPGFASGTAPGPANNPAPMPVKWIYVLKSGQLVSPTGNGASVTVAGATRDNPIVGRTAFWTDDETCKVNLNTASEGVFWDVPRCAGIDEVAFAVNQPTQGEWQRVPGHPATTCLSPIFPKLAGESDTGFFKRLSSYNPRTAWGGSEMGTKPLGSPVRFSTGKTYPTSADTLPALPVAVPTKTDRLLSSSDELYFTNNGTRTPITGLSSDEIQRRQFFLTATSRAPETNLFSQPRISIWPITWMNRGRWSGTTPKTAGPFQPSIPAGDPSINKIANNPSMEPSEKLIAFASSLGKDSNHNNELFRYFFTRQNSTSTTHDYTKIRRNQEIYAYLNGRLNNNIPGFGGRFVDKWGADKDQILTSTFDFLRSTLNLTTASSSYTNQAANYYYTPLVRRQALGEATQGQQDMGFGQVVPIKIASTRGMGRFPTITEAALLFYAIDREDCYTADTLKGANVTIDPAKLDPAKYITQTASQTKKIGMVLFFEMFNPVMGFPTPDPMYGIRISGGSFTVTSGTITGGPIGFPDGGQTNMVNSFNDASIRRDDRGGAFLGIHSQFSYRQPPANVNPFPKKLGRNPTWSGTAVTVYPFYADSIPVDPNTNSFTFTGGPTTIEIYAPDPANREKGDPVSSDRLVQTFTIDFSALNGTYPTPIAPRFYEGQPGLPAVADPLRPPDLEISKPFVNGASTALRYNYGYKGPISTEGTIVTETEGSRDFNNRISQIPVTYTAGAKRYIAQEFCIFSPYDTVMSMQLDPLGNVQGDPRMLAARQNVPSSWFQKVPVTNRARIPDGYPTQISPTAYVAQLRAGGLGDTSTASPYSTLEGLLDAPLFGADSPIAANTNTFAPIVAGRFNKDGIPRSGSSGPLADWSNGLGYQADGAIITKPGETNQVVTIDSGGTAQVPYFTPNIFETGAPIFSPNRQIASAVDFGGISTGTMRGDQPWQTLLFCPNPLAGAQHRGFTSPPDHLYLDLFMMPVAEPYPISESFSTAGKINLNFRMEPFNHIKRQTGLYAVLKSTKITALLLGQSYALKVMGLMGDGKVGGTFPRLNAYAPTNPSPTDGSVKAADVPALVVPGFPAVSHANLINSPTGGTVAAGVRTRFDINIPETLKDFDSKFDGGDMFRSASQICEMFLVPDPSKPSPTGSISPAGIPTTLAATKTWWSGTSAATDPVITGDNSRESPYAQIYPRVTTQSNTFAVHMRVQGLRKRANSAQDTWEEGKDQVVSEYRGSAGIERFVDPNDPKLVDVDFVTDTTKTLAPYYRWRILHKHQFAP